MCCGICCIQCGAFCLQVGDEKVCIAEMGEVQVVPIVVILGFEVMLLDNCEDVFFLQENQGNSDLVTESGCACILSEAEIHIP